MVLGMLLPSAPGVGVVVLRGVIVGIAVSVTLPAEVIVGILAMILLFAASMTKTVSISQDTSYPRSEIRVEKGTLPFLC